MKNLADISLWKQAFGLLPIKLIPCESTTEFVMLNGGQGDFCLQTVKDDNELSHFYSRSWSSNTSNFIVIEPENVKIFNWSKDTQENIPLQKVTDNFNKFYEYIVAKNYKSDKDVVPFIIDIFRQFRNITREKNNPVEALNLLFLLLASLEDDHTNIDESKWNITKPATTGDFDFFVDKIQTGVSGIKPEIELIIRHSAGILFQEAQKEVLFFDNQRDLFGGISNKLTTVKKEYSSIHYTPPYIARAIVENALNQIALENIDTLRVFDPACGSAEFLIEALKQLKERGFSGSIEIHGWDSSETAINTSKFLLTYEQRKIWKDKLTVHLRLVGDSLMEDWGQYDLILMNPPFVSWELLSTKEARDSVKQTLGNVLLGKPNQASAFFYKSLFHLSERGVVGSVIPSSLLTLNSYKKLRDEAFNQICISLIGKLGNFVFEDALTDVSLIIGKKHQDNLSYTTVLWTRNEKGVAAKALRDLRKMTYSNLSTVNEQNYSVFQPLNFPIVSDSWKTISLKENEFIKSTNRFVAEKRLVKVRDVFHVKQGINSGSNQLFKITDDTFNAFGSEEQRYFRPVVDNAAIKNGVLSIVNYVWYPYDERGLLIDTEEEFRRKAPQYFDMLYPHKIALSSRARKGVENWWCLSEHRNWLLTNEGRLVSARFGNSSSFAFDSDGKFVVENGSAWIPRKALTKMDYYFYLAIFSSTLFDSLLSIYSRQLSGGDWYDLGKKYVQDIPIPNIQLSEVENSSVYVKLSEIGVELSKGNHHLKIMASELLKRYFYPFD